MTAPSLVDVGILAPLEQTEYLRGDVRRPIAELPLAWCLEELRKMRAGAVALADKHAVYTAWDRRPVRVADPAAWIVGTPLYRAIAARLPRKRNPLTAIEQRARHDVLCPSRNGLPECNCTPRAAMSGAELLALVGVGC